ncbi:LPXTG cell wall anchor domain-containing protein [Demequina sp. NBRC 110052]|uniref:LPXTG cell wall anchor domain-containing protein n=1 Tax=Demequina sp. NBRC 110052 TaxID=1570341 RepID=UPI000A00455D|nr:LPXTG cell wall anchor domain-containing protein [Demequina sp. NBRC 110052]
MRLRAMLGRAAAVLSIAAVGAAVAAPAQAVAYDRYLTVSLTVPDDAPDVFDGLTFEIFGGTGALVFEIDATVPASAVAVPGGGECYVYVDDYVDYTEYTLDCGDLPAGSYAIGAAGADPSLGFYAECSTGLDLEPAADGTGEISLGESDDIFCALYPAYGAMMVSIFGAGFFTYTDTFLGFGELEYRLTGSTGFDFTFDGSSLPESDVPACDYEAPFEGLASIACEGLPLGTYTLSGSGFPEGAVVGEMTCLVAEPYEEGFPHFTESTAGFTIDTPGQFTYCLQYFGAGIPLFIDVDPSQVDVPLADIVIEVYDEDGALVAEGTDPSEDMCIPTESVDPESPYDLVVNPEACAVIMVAPPFSLPFTDSAIDFDWDSVSYSLGLRGPDGALGASSASTTVDYFEFGALAEPLGVEGSTAVLSTDWLNGTTATGAVMSVRAETIVLADTPAAPELPETGPTSPWAPAGAAASSILVGAFLLMRRRAQI